MTGTEKVLIVLAVIVLVICLLCGGCVNTGRPNYAEYVVTKKFEDHENIEIMNHDLKRMKLYVGRSEWRRVKVGYIFTAEDVIGKHPIWVDGRPIWVKD